MYGHCRPLCSGTNVGKMADIGTDAATAKPNISAIKVVTNILGPLHAGK